MNDQKANDGQHIVNLFAFNFFGTTYEEFKNTDLNYPEIAEECMDDFGNLNFIDITFSDLLGALLSLNVKKGAGPDGIPNVFLREYAVSLCEPFSGGSSG